MSGLEKFQASEAWRTNFKKFLFMDRKPEVAQKTLTITESQRNSLDIGEDLKNIIEQKKNKKTVQINLNAEIINIPNTTNESNQQQESNMNRCDKTAYEELQKTSDESFEALEKMCEKSVSDPNSTLYKYLNGENEQKSNNVVMWEKTSNESFEALEKMCDKTASDPNSTLFHYLHSDRKEQVLAEAKKRSADGIILNAQDKKGVLNGPDIRKLKKNNEFDNTLGDEENIAWNYVKAVIHNCLGADRSEDWQLHINAMLTSFENIDELLTKLNNCTLLDDIEAPSRMWENTICGDTLLQTSPIKMVGLLRPSTIIEEAPDDSTNSDVSSQMSFRTASKGAHSDVSSSENNSNKSVDLIDLEKTFGPFQSSPHSSILKEYLTEDNPEQTIECNENELENENVFDDSIIEILSDEETEDVQSKDGEEQKHTNIKMEMCSKTSSFNINHDTYSFNKSLENDKENCGPESLEMSMQFNDTMEEVEYMLKKGMEYMAAEAASKKSPPKVKASAPANNIQVSKTQPNSPLIHKKPDANASSFTLKVKPSTYTTPAKNVALSKVHNSSSKHVGMDIRPFPKLDIFAKPAAHARTKELASKQQKFSHIVSPIGAYMKKTAKTPLMSTINCKNKNCFNSTAILELENESRLYQPKFASDLSGSEASGVAKLPGLTTGSKRPLPKKAYISSDLKHIVDERTPITIPGGKKIQKYLENAMMPAVLRHEGKFKMPGGMSNQFNTPSSSSPGAPSKLPLKASDLNSTIAAKSSSHIPRRNNASLADLSVMSGDISMYTIMDAQKF